LARRLNRSSTKPRVKKSTSFSWDHEAGMAYAALYWAAFPTPCYITPHVQSWCSINRPPVHHVCDVPEGLVFPSTALFRNSLT
jgi:hypothetical protein